MPGTGRYDVLSRTKQMRYSIAQNILAAHELQLSSGILGRRTVQKLEERDYFTDYEILKEPYQFFEAVRRRWRF